MSSENFESLEDDFISFKNGLKSKIEDLLPKLYGQNRNNLLRELQRDLDEAQRLLEELEEEARNAPNPYRLQMNNQLKLYRQDLNFIKNKLSQSESSASARRNELLGPSGISSTSTYGSGNIAAGNRGRLLQMNETINKTSETVYRTQQIAAETDEVGIAVVDELGTQRESLIRTKERLVDTDVNLTRSRKILRSMYRRVMTNKLILIVIIILEVAILSGLVYYKFFRR